jgi:hypothetical protein
MNLLNMDAAGNVYQIIYDDEGTPCSEVFLYNINEIEKQRVICSGRNCNKI